jgi:quinol monooxygenase YgiN
MTTASDPSFRAVAILKAHAGRERELRALLAQVLPKVRRVAGLRKLEVSRSLSDPAQWMLYYWWDSPAHSETYVAGALYASIAPQLAVLVEEHLLVVGELFSE